MVPSNGISSSTLEHAWIEDGEAGGLREALVYYQLNMSDIKLVGKKSSHFVSLAGGLLFQVVCQDLLVIIAVVKA